LFTKRSSHRRTETKEIVLLTVEGRMVGGGRKMRRSGASVDGVLLEEDQMRTVFGFAFFEFEFDLSFINGIGINWGIRVSIIIICNIVRGRILGSNGRKGGWVWGWG
jgi:hypothetical protein